MSDDGLCPECGAYISDVPESTGSCPNCGADLSDYDDEEFLDDDGDAQAHEI